MIVSTRVGTDTKNIVVNGSVVNQEYIPLNLPTAPPIKAIPINRNNNSSASNAAEHLCVLCYDATVCIMLEPCHHVCFCEACEEGIRRRGVKPLLCPICRVQYSRTQKIYLC